MHGNVPKGILAEMKIPSTNRIKERLIEFRDSLRESNDWILVLFVVGLGVFLRLWQIGEIPPGVSPAENNILTQLTYMSPSKLWLGGEFYKGAYLYFAFAATKIFGTKVIVLRVLSAIFGSLTVWLSYLFISKWFSKKIAIFTAFLLAISTFHITMSRLIVPEIMLPVVLLALFVTLTSAYRSKNIWLFGFSGALGALGLYTSPAFLFVPVIFIVSAIYFYLKNKKFISAYRDELIVGLVAFVALSIPYVVSFAQNPMAYLTYFGFNRSGLQLVMNIGQIPNLLFISTPPNFFLNMGTEPLLDPFIYITAVAGFFFALFKIGRRKYFFLIVWLTVFSVYAALKRGVQIIDLVGILPVLYAFAALILDYVLDVWFKTFPLNKGARRGIVALIAIFFALSALYNFDRYFVAYKHSNEVKKEFSATPVIPLK